jgi:signal transduction histidine kinase
MSRLYRQIYLTIIASLALVVVFALALWQFVPNPGPSRPAFELAGELVGALIPALGEGAAAQQTAINQLYNRLKLDLALYSPDLQVVAAAGRRVPKPRNESGGWLYGAGGPAWAIRLPDERWVVVRAPSRQRHPLFGIFAFLGGIALAVALCAYPLVRRLTGRLERLQTGVESLGAGDLSARVKVEGKDEVAQLAKSFNQSAARIEELVRSHRLLLANASHELRTPLSRVRLGIELLKEHADPQRKRDLEKDISELDTLIDEILLSSRLDATKTLDRSEEIDLLAIVAEEAARYERCTAWGEPVTTYGDPTLLRRMVRNLIENAERHGTPPIDVQVIREGSNATIVVNDHGRGIPADARERVFSPFFRLAQGERTTGAGLGLSLVRQIARQHGGDAFWHGTADQPSSIKINLPITPAAR